jgi:hypothetical protein
MDLKTRITLVRLYYENVSSSSAALRKFTTLHGYHNDPFPASSVQRLVAKFEGYGSVEVYSIEKQTLVHAVDRLFDRLLCSFN